jgi:hypothetical protein
MRKMPQELRIFSIRNQFYPSLRFIVFVERKLDGADVDFERRVAVPIDNPCFSALIKIDVRGQEIVARVDGQLSHGVLARQCGTYW